MAAVTEDPVEFPSDPSSLIPFRSPDWFIPYLEDVQEHTGICRNHDEYCEQLSGSDCLGIDAELSKLEEEEKWYEDWAAEERSAGLSELGEDGCPKKMDAAVQSLLFADQMSTEYNRCEWNISQGKVYDVHELLSSNTRDYLIRFHEDRIQQVH